MCLKTPDMPEPPAPEVMPKPAPPPPPAAKLKINKQEKKQTAKQKQERTGSRANLRIKRDTGLVGGTNEKPKAKAGIQV